MVFGFLELENIIIGNIVHWKNHTKYTRGILDFDISPLRYTFIEITPWLCKYYNGRTSLMLNKFFYKESATCHLLIDLDP
jgi:hypothetical protein